MERRQHSDKLCPIPKAGWRAGRDGYSGKALERGAFDRVGLRLRAGDPRSQTTEQRVSTMRAMIVPIRRRAEGSAQSAMVIGLPDCSRSRIAPRSTWGELHRHTPSLTSYARGAATTFPCTYSLQATKAADMVEAAGSHHHSIIRGKWDIFDKSRTPIRKLRAPWLVKGTCPSLRKCNS